MTVSLGKMNGFAEIRKRTRTKDAEGFTTPTESVLAQVRCYREDRHGSERWENIAAFSEATDLFRIRAIPGTPVTCDYFIVCDGERFEITSVENVKGRGMYIEILAKKVVPGGTG